MEAKAQPVFRDFEVLKSYGDDEDFFRLQTPQGEVTLAKLPFQKGRPLPDTLSCRVKGQNAQGLPILGHNMPAYVNEFYGDGFYKGQNFEFKVIEVPSRKTGFYRIVDDNGLIFRLREPKTTLSMGQTVKCRFNVLEHDRFELSRAASDTMMPMEAVDDVLRYTIRAKGMAYPMDNGLWPRPAAAQSVEECERGYSTWVLTAIREISEQIPQWFNDARSQLTDEQIDAVLYACRNLSMYLLQGSGYLRNSRGNERHRLQEYLTSRIEQIEAYMKAQSIISRGTEKQFIQNLLHDLKESAYLYHPNQQFMVMMIIFRMLPGLVNTSLGNIFDTLMSWDVDTWKVEPFRTATVDLLEMYINDSRGELDRVVRPETAAENEHVEKVLTAVAIQQELTTMHDAASREVNMSVFYRYLSMLRPTCAATVLEKSYLTLLGVKLPTDFRWSDIKETTMMMTRATVPLPLAAWTASTRYFQSEINGVQVSVGLNGITIGYDVMDETEESVIPNDWLGWPGVAVRDIDIPSLTRAKSKTMTGHQEFWENVENALFTPEVPEEETRTTLLRPDINDYVRIIIDRVTPTPDGDIYNCHVIDSHFQSVDGIMHASELVQYQLHDIPVGTFRFADGHPMVFEAKVIKIDENDRPEFSLREQTFDAGREMANTGETCLCVITKDNGRSYSAKSERGFGLFVNKVDDGMPPFHNGNVIRVTITGFVNNAVQGIYEEGPIDNYKFDNAAALHRLLMEIAIDDRRDDDDESDYEFDPEDALTAESMHEVIEILRFYAVANQSEPLRAYDYLSVAQILAIAAEDEDLTNVIRAQKEVLKAHQFYATNRFIEGADVERIRALAPNDSYVRRRADRLDIVASLGHPENNERLWEIVSSHADDTDRELAQMVISYNLLTDADADSELAHPIKTSIANKLNVSFEQRTLKYYGSESQFVEFKSSMVYPAAKGKAGISMADPDRQEHEILHIIAGMLNTQGGKLYIGVSDDHYERGLEDDYSYYKRDTTSLHRRNIRNADNLTNYLQILIDSRFNLGKTVGEYAKTFIDEDSSKGVIYVEINPCPRTVLLDGELYVRHGTKTEPLVKDDEKRRFHEDRQMLYRQTMMVEEEATATANKEVVTAPAAVEPTREAEATAVSSSDEAAVKTSQARPNILHEYIDSDKFVSPHFYLHFPDAHHYMVTTDEWHKSVDDPQGLTLAVTEAPESTYILLVYEGEAAVKVQASRLLQMEQNVLHKLCPDRALVFACPASNDEGLYCLLVNQKGTIYERVTPVSRIAEGTMKSVPERLIDLECESSPYWETIHAKHMGNFTDLLPANIRRNQLGAMVRTGRNAKVTIDSSIENLQAKLKGQ